MGSWSEAFGRHATTECLSLWIGRAPSRTAAHQTNHNRYNTWERRCRCMRSNLSRVLANDKHSYISSILGFKLSLLLTYLRFMTKGTARIATLTVIVACVLFHLSFLLVQVNLCQPVRPVNIEFNFRNLFSSRQRNSGTRLSLGGVVYQQSRSTLVWLPSPYSLM